MHPPTTIQPPTNIHPPSTSIDMLNPAEACVRLSVDDDGLIALVNDAELTAYSFDGEIRFGYREVSVLVSRRVASA